MYKGGIHFEIMKRKIKPKNNLQMFLNNLKRAKNDFFKLKNKGYFVFIATCEPKVFIVNREMKELKCCVCYVGLLFNDRNNRDRD